LCKATTSLVNYFADIDMWVSILIISRERIIQHCLQGVTKVTKNQFGFMPGRSAIEGIFLLRQLIDRYRDQKKDMHMVFIAIENAYVKALRNVMWWAL
jgi:phosphoheptose isomerase